MLEESPPDNVKVCLVGKPGVGKHSLLSTYLTLCSTAHYASKQLQELHSTHQVSVQRTIGMVSVIVTMSCVSSLDTPENIAMVLGAGIVVLVFDLLDDPRFTMAGDLMRSIDLHSKTRSNGKRIHYAILGTKSDLCSGQSGSLAVSNAAVHLRDIERYAVSTTPGKQHEALSAIDALVTSAHARMLSKITLGTKAPAIMGDTGGRVTLPDAPVGSGGYGTTASREALNPAVLTNNGTPKVAGRGSRNTVTIPDDDEGYQDNALARGIISQMPSVPSDVGQGAPKQMGELRLENNSLVDMELDRPLCQGGEVCVLI